MEYPQNAGDVEFSPQGTGLGTLNHSATVTIQALHSMHR